MCVKLFVSFIHTAPAARGQRRKTKATITAAMVAMAAPVRLELTTLGLTVRCSTD